MVKNISLTESVGCQRNDIRNWEQKHNVQMPHDMEDIYLASNGLRLTWDCAIDTNDDKPAGTVYYPKLQDLVDVNTSLGKAFILDKIDDLALVCLVYKTPNPRIYIYEIGSSKWRLLAFSFAQYQRASVAYLGLRHWQLSHYAYDKPAGIVYYPELHELVHVNTSVGRAFILENINDQILVCLVYETIDTLCRSPSFSPPSREGSRTVSVPGW